MSARRTVQVPLRLWPGWSILISLMGFVCIVLLWKFASDSAAYQAALLKHFPEYVPADFSDVQRAWAQPPLAIALGISVGVIAITCKWFVLRRGRERLAEQFSKPNKAFSRMVWTDAWPFLFAFGAPVVAAALAHVLEISTRFAGFAALLPAAALYFEERKLFRRVREKLEKR